VEDEGWFVWETPNQQVTVKGQFLWFHGSLPHGHHAGSKENCGQRSHSWTQWLSPFMKREFSTIAQTMSTSRWALKFEDNLEGPLKSWQNTWHLKRCITGLNIQRQGSSIFRNWRKVKESPTTLPCVHHTCQQNYWSASDQENLQCLLLL
jgi:hypothetical protein